MPSSLLVTPPSSPPVKRARLDIDVKRSSAALFEDDENENKENVVTVNAIAEGKAVMNNTKQGSIRGFFTALPRPKPAPLQPVPLGVPRTTPTAASRLTPQTRPLKAPTSLDARSKTVRPASTAILQQSYLTHLPLLETCKACCMTYVRGGGDEGLHARHHGRVMRGISWEGLGKGKGKVKGETGWREIKEITFGRKGEGKGRVVVCEGSWGGSKVSSCSTALEVHGAVRKNGK